MSDPAPSTLSSDNPHPSQSHHSQYPVFPFPPNIDPAIIELEREVASQSADRNEEIASGKGTGRAYKRHPERYERWWAQREASRAAEAEAKGLPYVPVPAHPIIGAKVALFMEEDRKRPCVRHLPTPFLMFPDLPHALGRQEWQSHPGNNCRSPHEPTVHQRA